MMLLRPTTLRIADHAGATAPSPIVTGSRFTKVSTVEARSCVDRRPLSLPLVAPSRHADEDPVSLCWSKHATSMKRRSSSFLGNQTRISGRRKVMMVHRACRVLLGPCVPHRQPDGFGGDSRCGRDHDLVRLKAPMPGLRARSVIAHCVVWAAIGGCMASCSPGTPQPLTSSALECTGNMHDGPPEDYTVLFDAVALPAAPAHPVLGTVSNSEHRSTPRWSKVGLWFRPTAPFSLRIADDSGVRSGMGWGYPANRSRK